MAPRYRDKDTAMFAARKRVPRFQAIQDRGFEKLSSVSRAESLQELAKPPSNRLEALRGDRAGQYSIRINRQWRICFEWDDMDGAVNIEIVDYH